MQTMRRIGCLLIVVLSSAAFAQRTPTKSHEVWEPPDWSFPEDVKATVNREMLSTLRISDYPIQLEETKLDDTGKHFGGTVGSKGDASEYEAWLCSHGADTGGRWVLWLESGEIDGGYVGSFQWRRLSTTALIDKRCVALNHAPQLPLSLNLGMQAAEVLKTLGRPSWQSHGRLIYLHEHTKTIRGEPYDSSNIVTVHLRAGLVWAIAVSKTTSS